MRTDSAVIDALDPADRARLLGRAVPRRLARGQAICLAGDRARRAHLVASGVIKLTARSGDGHSAILCLARPGEIVGEVAAIDGWPQPLDAIAATPADVVGVDADLLLELLARNAAAALEVARVMAQRARWLCDSALERSTSTVPARLAGRLLDLADLLGHPRGGAIEIELPLAQEDLGRLAGMCRESACKTLRAFKSEGVLDYRGRRLRILRPDALERIRCAGRR
ncbi:MAG: Crp/Fnr family transcriptional regulator [Actinomycetota bacterium]